MKKTVLMEKYPVFTLEIEKSETVYESVDAIIDYFKTRVETDPVAVYVGIFDHYAHTTSLENGEVAPQIKAAKNILFCFGQKLPDPKMLAVRPRSIGVAETDSGFSVTFLEAPMQPMNEKMETWAKELMTIKE